MNSDYYRQKPKRVEFLWKRDPEGGILLRMWYSQVIINLGPIGVDIYERLNAKTTIAEILEFLKGKYYHIPPSQIEYDTYQFLHWLQSLGLALVYWDDF